MPKYHTPLSKIISTFEVVLKKKSSTNLVISSQQQPDQGDDGIQHHVGHSELRLIRHPSNGNGPNGTE
jgi:hypothetical protein